MTGLRAYHGTISGAVHHQVDCLQLTPQPSGHLRVHTLEVFKPPVAASWWIYTLADMRPAGTTGGPHMDGLHVHFGHLDNDLNGLIHLVRRDGASKVTTQHGLTGYHDIRHGRGLPLRLWRRYLFDLEWRPDQVRLSVANDNHIGPGIETAEIVAALPPSFPRGGHIGWRLDNLTVRLGGLVVRSLTA